MNTNELRIKYREYVLQDEHQEESFICLIDEICDTIDNNKCDSSFILLCKNVYDYMIKFTNNKSIVARDKLKKYLNKN